MNDNLRAIELSQHSIEATQSLLESTRRMEIVALLFIASIK